MRRKSEPRGGNATRKLLHSLRRRITAGQWAVGERLPTTRALAREFSVSINTVQRAFGQLEAQHLVECRGRTRHVAALSSRVVTAPAQRGTQVFVIQSPIQASSTLPPGSRWGSTIVESIKNELHSQGLQLTLVGVDIDKPGAEAELLSQLDRARANLWGVVCFPQADDVKLTRLLDQQRVAWVTINRPTDYAYHNFVSADFLGAGRQVGVCFGRLNLRRVLLLSSAPAAGQSWSETIAGFVQGYSRLNLPLHGIDCVACDTEDEAEHGTAFRAYLRDHEPPQAILTGGDVIALSCIRVLREKGLRVPEDVAVIGGTGLDIGRYSDPPLSAISQPMHKIGTHAVQLLGELTRTGLRRIPGRVVPTPLVLRNSVRVTEEIKAELRQMSQAANASAEEAVVTV